MLFRHEALTRNNLPCGAADAQSMRQRVGGRDSGVRSLSLGMRDVLTTPLVELAERQSGVVSARQLSALGLDKHAVTRGLSAGRLHRLHRGVFAVGHRVLTQRGIWWAAVLACGDGAVLSHRSASSLLGFWSSSRRDVDVIAPRRVRQQGIAAHRHALHPADHTTSEGLPTTTPERTLVDLADVLFPRQLEHAYDNARINRSLSLKALDAALDRARGRHGAPKLQAIVRRDRPAALTTGPLERALLDVIRAGGLPEPVANGYLHGRQIDFHWPKHRLIVETDGRQHDGARARREDYRRDALLLADGWRTLRFSYDQVMNDPAFVLGVLVPLLA
jgi:hypothetical protein